MKFKVLISIFAFSLCFSPTVNLLQGQDYDKDENPVEVVMKKLNCSDREAKEFLKYVSKQIGVVQIALSEIVSQRRTKTEKKEIIDFLLEYVVEKDAFVFVSSKIFPNEIRRFSIKEYLYHLAHLSEAYRYKSASLYFHPNFLYLIGFEYDPNYSYYEMHILVKQYFEGLYREYGAAYKDLSFKNLMCTVREIRKGEFELKLKSIQVKETLDVTDEELAQARLDFDKFRLEAFGISPE